MARSAPFEVAAAGESLTVATPLVSVSAEGALNVPRPPEVEKLTTCPGSALPLASSAVADTVAGAAAVTVVEEIASTTLGDGVVVPVPVPDPPPSTGVPALPPPPPHAACSA